MRYLHQAGAKAATRSALQSARSYYTQALGALESIPESRWSLEEGFEIRLALRTALLQLGEFGQTLEILREAESIADRRPLSKTWRVSLVELNRVAEVEEGEQGVLDGLKQSGLVEGRDYTTSIKNAKGDMATVSALIDGSQADSDLLITFSTPTLQSALQRVKRIPVVFNYVANPFVAGAGKTDNEHAPNVTGV